jgi:hypothetical protein
MSLERNEREELAVDNDRNHWSGVIRPEEGAV